MAAKIKSAIVPFPDGTKRVLHCMESPEHWFEDFGAGKLKDGRAVVRLDRDFAKVIRAAGYHVFLTLQGECRGLSVRRQGAKSFEVRELMGGKSAIAFSYRIVGRRKDIKGHRRFAKIDTGLRLPVPRVRPARRARRPKIARPTPAELRAFAAQMKKLAGAQTQKAQAQTQAIREVAEEAPFKWPTSSSRAGAADGLTRESLICAVVPRARGDPYSRVRWLWVPAFAGTTAESCRPNQPASIYFFFSVP